jgi:hypothetical protein
MSGDRERWNLFYEQTFVSSEIQMEGPITSNLTIFLNTRRAYYDLVAPLLIKGESWNGLQFPYIWDGLFRMKWEMTPSGILLFTGYGSLEGMKWNLSAGDDNPGVSPKGYFFYQLVNMTGSVRYSHNFDSDNSFAVVRAFTPIFGTNHLGENLIIQMDQWENEPFYRVSMDYYMR